MSTATAVISRRSASLFTSTWVVASRAIRKNLRTPHILFFSTVQSVVFLLIFRYVFGGAITTGGLPYVDFMVPGVLTVCVLFAGIRSALSVAQDMQEGFFDRLRSLPMPRAAVIAGRVVADTILIACVLAITAVIAFAVGFRIHADWTRALAAFGLCVLFGFAFIWVFVALGLLTRNVQAAQGISFLVLPLSFVSSTYVPVSTMPSWLQPFAEYQPVTVMINVVRTLTQGTQAEAFLGHNATYYLVQALFWTLAIIVVFALISIASFQRS